MQGLLGHTKETYAVCAGLHTQGQQDCALATVWVMEISWAVSKTKYKQRSAEDYEGMNKSSRHNDSRGQFRNLVKGRI